MAQVVVAKEAGACFGVERALEMVERAARETAGSLHTLGPLIHNPVVVESLQRKGVTVVEDPAEASAGSTLLMRTHGVAPQVEEQARALGLEVLDATCPYVKKVHRSAARLAREGYQVLVVGERGHPEVEGTVGHAPGALVVGSAREADALEVGRRVGLVVQTTLAQDVLAEVVQALLGRCEELRLVDTICEATAERQRAATELAERADVMVVIGGRNSANTTHLAQLCGQRCSRTHHIELPGELQRPWFEDASVVGVTAGASTPAAHIRAVCARIEELSS